MDDSSSTHTIWYDSSDPNSGRPAPSDGTLTSHGSLSTMGLDMEKSLSVAVNIPMPTTPTTPLTPLTPSAMSFTAASIDRAVSRTSNLNEPGPPPDGGKRAWAQVIMGHIVVFNTWGLLNSFGVFQSYYTRALGRSPSDISWVGSAQIFLLFSVGTLSGRATDAGYFRFVFLLGSAFILIGIFLTSICETFWQLVIAQGVCIGIGNGLLFCPAVAVISTYFTKRRAVAMSIAVCGTATGGVVFPFTAQSLLPKIGFAWTVRCMGLIMFCLQLIAIVLAKPRLPPRKTGPLIELKAFTEIPYLLFAVGIFLAFLGIYPAIFYISEFGVSVIGLSQHRATYLVMILNGCSIVGRTVPAYFADHYFGPLNVIIFFVFTSTVIFYCWLCVTSETGLMIFAVFYGMSAAAVQSLFPSTLSTLTTDMTKMGVRMGMVFTVVSFACLLGSPIAGALVQEGRGSFIYMQLFGASTLLGGGIILVAGRLCKTGMKAAAKI